jgi:hypothetical protein
MADDDTVNDGSPDSMISVYRLAFGLVLVLCLFIQFLDQLITAWISKALHS